MAVLVLPVCWRMRSSLAASGGKAASARHYRETVFRNAVQASYNGAKWAHFRDNPNRPILRYVAVNDSRTRPSHKALHGLMMPMDDPRWQTLSPPGGHGCRCTLMSLSERQAKAMGYDGAPKDLPTWTDKHGHDHVCQPDKGWAHSPENQDLIAYLREKERKAGLSRAVFDAGKTDAPVAWTPPSPDGSAESQIRYDIITRGQEEGVEYAAIVGEGGLLLAMVRGEADKVDLRDLLERHIDIREIVHNHPSGLSLSRQDLLTASAYNIRVTALATWSEGEFTARALVSDTVLYAHYYEAETVAKRFIAAHYLEGTISKDEAFFLLPHIVNKILHDKGIIDYNVLNYPPNLKELMNRIDAK